jgi:hypothetical protein
MFKAGCRQKALKDLEEHGATVETSREIWGEAKLTSVNAVRWKAGRDSNSARNHLIKAAFGKDNY